MVLGVALMSGMRRILSDAFVRPRRPPRCRHVRLQQQAPSTAWRSGRMGAVRWQDLHLAAHQSVRLERPCCTGGAGTDAGVSGPTTMPAPSRAAEAGVLCDPEQRGGGNPPWHRDDGTGQPHRRRSGTTARGTLPAQCCIAQSSPRPRRRRPRRASWP